eukprot:scaffold153118_cov17-Tisochrysis_lutea.AAC.1
MQVVVSPSLLPSHGNKSMTRAGVQLGGGGGGSGAAGVAITGGTGGLGLLVAGWLASMGAASHIRLISRTGRAALDGPFTDLARTHVLVTSTAADISTAADAEGVWVQQPGGLPVSAVFHAAGVLTDAMVGQQSHAKLRNDNTPYINQGKRRHICSKSLESPPPSCAS